MRRPIMLTHNGGRSIWQLARGPVVAWLMVVIPAASAGTASSGIAKDKIAGGEHWRVRTSRGPVHVWCPALYDRRTAGTVVYVHRYAVGAYGGWERHQLPPQVQANPRNPAVPLPPAPPPPQDNLPFP